ncbi:hypothetical protein P4H71_07010 [Paenibacillus kribbensis]|uniref:hypothetical protein n=1 Tax=Paenibacillus kribbensis TaxID=172713 RepID=UPI002DBA0F5F|nr:hypothetical protein [Paenibacillus kribbensis]MEC0234080.1 hypothetical protein [Paenibacillus kribbensis]
MLPKWGICSTADEASGTITATFPDREDFVTGDLQVVFPAGALRKTLPQPGDEVFVIMFDRTNGVCFGVSSEFVNKEGDAEMKGTLTIDGNVKIIGTPPETGGLKAVGEVKGSNI